MWNHGEADVLACGALRVRPRNKTFEPLDRRRNGVRRTTLSLTQAPQITVLGVVTHDRVTSLAACLKSYIDCCRRYARTPEYVVMNDVIDDNVAGTTSVRATLRAVRASEDVTIRYAGSSEKRRFAARLARESLIARDIIDFALFGDPRCRLLTGANRNGLLLDTVGSLVFSTDDDTLARSFRARESRNEVSFSVEDEPREFWFFPDRRAALEAVPPTDSDLLACHERFLGRPLTEIGGPAGMEGRVVLTLPGLVGDSGMGSPHVLLTLSAGSRSRLLASQAAYLSALRSREMLRTVHQPTIAASSFCMTTFFGFDNRRLLPPFFPVARNSDGIFGLTVQRSIEGSHVAFLPSALLHAPPEPRRFAGDEAWTEPKRVRMADVLIAATLVHDVAPAAGGPSARLHRLGQYLRELASLKSEDFEAFLRSAQQLRTMAFTALLETRLREHSDGPAFWADDVRQAIAFLRGTATRNDYIVPRDLGNAGDEEDTRRLTQQLVAKFGQLLETWPALVEAASRLRAKGCRVSVPV